MIRRLMCRLGFHYWVAGSEIISDRGVFWCREGKCWFCGKRLPGGGYLNW